ncbi:helix-turn-helix domain-containing protein [Myxococcota bacterium]|nr:helix-turn-helix domain-containing protein [Myxococcota bacterium]
MMKTIDELDHYEVLEVARDARRDEIERAFTLVRAAYGDDALAAYSVLSHDETKLWRERIEEAWRVLSDSDRRRVYDATLDGDEDFGDDSDPFAGVSDDDGAASGSGWLRFDEVRSGRAETDRPPREPAPLPEAPNSLPSFAGDPYRERPLAIEAAPAPERTDPHAFESFEESAGVDIPWDGPRLRRTRLSRGLEIEDVVRVTKINPTYLRFLEDERFDDLPAIVYVRGFVAAYARLLGLDPSQVAPSYVSRCEAHRGQPHRGRLDRGPGDRGSGDRGQTDRSRAHGQR